MENILSFFSILLNLFFLCLVWLFIQKRGGISYIKGLWSRFQSQDSPTASYHFPYYYHRASQLQQLSIASTDIVMLGDSITDEGEWAELLANPSVRNRGISGDTTDGLLDRLEPMLKAKPKVILLMIGINDLLNDGKQSEQIGENYKKILTQIQATTPDTTVFVQSVLPINDCIFGRSCDRKIIQVNQLIKSLAATFGHQYIDLFSSFANKNNQLDAQYTQDGVHLNGKAYQIWAQVILPYLAQSQVNSLPENYSDLA